MRGRGDEGDEGGGDGEMGEMGEMKKLNRTHPPHLPAPPLKSSPSPPLPISPAPHLLLPLQFPVVILMNSDADFQLSSLASPDFLQELGAELVFTQDASGKYLSFYWQQAENYKLNPEKIVGCQMSETFGPVAIAPYLDRVRRALDGQMPERFSYPFTYAEQYFPFDLVIKSGANSQWQSNQSSSYGPTVTS